MAVDSPNFEKWINELEGQTPIKIHNLESYKAAILKKLDDFEDTGSFVSDHALDAGFEFQLPSEKKVADLFEDRLQQASLSEIEDVHLKSYLLHFLGKEYGSKGWVMQLHIGAQRYTSSRLRKMAGPTRGFAGIGKSFNINTLSSFLDLLEKAEALPKTILYNLNPSANEAIAT